MVLVKDGPFDDWRYTFLKIPFLICIGCFPDAGSFIFQMACAIAMYGAGVLIESFSGPWPLLARVIQDRVSVNSIVLLAVQTIAHASLVIRRRLMIICVFLRTIGARTAADKIINAISTAV